jgi:outer membrane protein
MGKTLFITLIFSIFTTKAQELWDLKKCIDFALENNLQIKQGQLNKKISEANYLRSKLASFPSVNGFVSHNYNFGRTIDPFTNQFATQTVQSNAFSISANWVLFNGFQTINAIRQNNFNSLASKYDLEKIKNDIVLAVISAYLNIIYLEEQLQIAEQQITLSQKQVDRISLLVNTGSAARGSLLDMQAQLANDELQKVNIQNQLDIAYLNLMQLMELNSQERIKIVKPQTMLPVEDIFNKTPSSIYQEALNNQPDIKAAELRVKSAYMGLLSAKGSYYPRLIISTSFGTGYSGLRKEVIGKPILSGFDTIGVTTSMDFVLVPNYAFDTRVIPFNRQLEDNLNRTIGLSLTIPIFNAFQAKTSSTLAKIQKNNAELALESAKRQLEKNIQQAYADAMAAYKKYLATEKSVNALAESFSYTEQRFNVGAANTFEYNDAKTRLARAKAELLQSKFDYAFKVKILDFYLGKPLDLN